MTDQTVLAMQIGGCMKVLCYVNGQIQSTSDALIGVADLGLQRGYGVFDFGRTYHGKLFHLKDHLARLRRSASELHLKLPISDKEITGIANQLIRESDLKTPSVRLILTGGYSYSSPALAHPVHGRNSCQEMSCQTIASRS